MEKGIHFKLYVFIAGLYTLLFGQAYGVLWREDVAESEVLKKAKPFTSVVWVETEDGHGSGVLIGPRTVLTAAHVADGCKPFVSRVLAHDAAGGEEAHAVLAVHFPEDTLCISLEEELFEANKDIAIIELLAPVDTNRFHLASFVGESEDTSDLTPLLRSNYFLEFEGVGYGLWGSWGSEPTYPDGQRRYYQSRGAYDYDLDPETGLPLLETLSFYEYSNLDNKESLLPFSGVAKPGDSGSPVFDPQSGCVFALCVNGLPVGMDAEGSEHNEMSGYVSLYPHLSWILKTRSHIEQMSSPVRASGGVLTYDLEGVALDVLTVHLDSDNIEALERLFQGLSIDLNARDSLGHYPLGKAVYQGDVRLANLLLEHGANPNHDNGSGYSWLELAVFTENIELADLLRQWGALDKVTVDPVDGLCQAARETEMLDYLVQYGKHSISAFVGSDPLAAALLESSEGERPFVAALLLRSGADYMREDYLNQTPLLGSISIYDTSTVYFLLENGVDPNVPDSKGRLPIVQAVMGGYYPIVKALLEHGADPDAGDALGRTPLYAALMPEEGGVLDTSLLKLLLDYGACVDKGHRYSKEEGLLPDEHPLLATALFDWADLGVATWLLEHGSDPDAKDVDIGDRLFEITQSLIRNYEREGDSHLFMFFKDVEDLLLKHGATPLSQAH